jgi:Flp pilus assembly protein TadB
MYARSYIALQDKGSIIETVVCLRLFKGRRNTQHNDTQHNDTQHNEAQHNDAQDNDTQNNDTQHTNQNQNSQLTKLCKTIKKCDTQHNYIQHTTRYWVMLCCVLLILIVVKLDVVMLSVTTPFKCINKRLIKCERDRHDIQHNNTQHRLNCDTQQKH